MNKKVTEEGNRMIAEFMGYRIDGNWIWLNENDQMSIINLKYDKDWNSLMPVVEKVESLGWTVFMQTWKKAEIITSYSCMMIHKKLHTVASDQCDSKIESVYLAVLSFLKFYNQANDQTEK